MNQTNMNNLKFIAISGTTSVTHNLYIYEYGNEMLVVDCGVGFPDIKMRGVDLILPDFSYVVKNKNKLKGILLTQGHEDHAGALPYLLSEIQTDVYAPPLVAALVKDKLEEHGVVGSKINAFDPAKDVLTIGSFKVTPFIVSHSIPDTLGYSIDTPEGQVFHVAEHKFDPEPVSGQKFDEEKAKRLASKGVLFLASDCLGSNRPGSTPSEKDIKTNLLNIFKNANQAIFFTTISSNIGRIQQVIDNAKTIGRKVVFVGFSIARKAEIAHDLGYLKYDRNTVVDIRASRKIRPENLLYIIAGCYGDPTSSLYRLSVDEHHKVSVEKGDTVVFSADPAPPYSKESQDIVIDNLIEREVDVHYYDLKEGLYVSGHGSQEDILKLFDMVKPKYYVPVGGTVRFMEGYMKLAKKHGIAENRVFTLKPGESVQFESGEAKRGPSIPIKKVYVDGFGIGDVGSVVLNDRNLLSQAGVVVPIVKINEKNQKLESQVEIITRGFVYEAKTKNFIMDAQKALFAHISKSKRINVKTVKEDITSYLENYLYKEIGRKPVILPVVIMV